MEIYRHGDLLIRKVKSIPGRCKVKKSKSCIVAEGEATGHNHELVAQFGGEVGMGIVDGVDTYISVQGVSAVLKHPEHKKIVLKPGNYQVGKEREHDYFLGHARNVVD